MNANVYLQWHYMVFLAPMAAAAFLLLLSSLRIGGHRGGHSDGMRHHAGAGGGGGMRHHAGAGGGGARPHTGGAGVRHHAGGGAAKAAGRAGGGKPAARNGRTEPETSDTAHMPWAAGFLVALLGIGKAPLPLVIEMFCLCWGVAGFWANRMLLPADIVPSAARMLPSLAIALGGGLVGSRIAAEIVARVLPKDETAIVSRNGLFGLTGLVVYPVTTGGGRVHIYDEFRTLHDETCRVAANCPDIPKGRHALVVDIAPDGNLIVEEAPEPIRLD